MRVLTFATFAFCIAVLAMPASAQMSCGTIKSPSKCVATSGCAWIAKRCTANKDVNAATLGKYGGSNCLSASCRPGVGKPKQDPLEVAPSTAPAAAHSAAAAAAAKNTVAAPKAAQAPAVQQNRPN